MEPPRNAELAGKRKPNLLHPGDVLWVPHAPPVALPIRKGTSNRYVAKVPLTPVQLVFKDDAGPIANEPYTVQGLGAEQQGTTDGDGKVVLQVPVTAREVQVVLTRRQVIHPVRIGDMDPIVESSGVRKRLQHLGFYRQPAPAGALDHTEDEQAECDQEALAAFQRISGLDATGVIDDATRAELLKRHGS
jgi:Putative peptidoglycan binding domain